MIIFVWVAGAVLIGAMLVFAAYASAMGGVGVLTQSSWERCPRCGHHGLVHGGSLHPQVCPVPALARVTHLRHPGAGHLPRR